MTRLEKFLTNRGLLKEFEMNYSIDMCYGEFLTTYGSHRKAIQWCFEWARTPEGDTHWNNLNKEWLTCLDENIL